jgi:hypothetical protein
MQLCIFFQVVPFNLQVVSCHKKTVSEKELDNMTTILYIVMCANHISGKMQMAAEESILNCEK